MGFDLTGLLSDGTLWAGLAGLGGSLTDTMVNSSSSKEAQKRSYKYTLALQEQAQAWAEKMSNTAHQREVDDLRQAGLNPILSATGGNGASTPVASGGSVGTGSVLPAAFGNSAATASRLAKDIYEMQHLSKRKVETDIENAKKTTQADVKLKEAQSRYYDDQRNRTNLPFGISVPGSVYGPLGNLIERFGSFPFSAFDYSALRHLMKQGLPVPSSSSSPGDRSRTFKKVPITYGEELPGLRFDRKTKTYRLK